MFAKKFKPLIIKQIGCVIAALCLSIVTLSSCIKPENPEIHALTDHFIQAIDTNQTAVAYEMLASETRTAINPNQFIVINRDFRDVLNLFRDAKIEATTKERLSVYVPRLDGKEGAVTFYLYKENGPWKIVNITEYASE